ncbi:unnamed protein product [Phytomonas sp. EM1]|nr:unnamed protein product [Phytomonas sp. EM1]|eukprot:CCW63276.1 unnamed protein product [Phytomonas sp. isolate EM1]
MCLYPPNKRNWRLYSLLELDDSVTTKQVKWYFRRVSLRNQYQQAYFVLYSRARKHLYDAVGEDVYGFIVSGAWGPLISFLGATGSIVMYCITMLIQVVLLSIFFVFLGAKVENIITFEWSIVILPLKVFGLVMCFFTFISILVNLFSSKTYKEGLSLVDRLSPFGNCFASVCYSCLPFVIGSAVSNEYDKGVGHYMMYMSMPILGDVLYYLTSLIWRWPQRIRLQMQINDNKRRSSICYGIFLMAFLNMGCGIAQWVLLGKKLDRKIESSWYIVFIPFCFRAGIRVLEALLRSLMRYSMCVRNKSGVAFDVIGSFFSNGILLISLYFVAVFLEREDHLFSFFLALIPVYATLGYILVCLVITMIVLLSRVSRSVAAEKRANKQWIPPDEREVSVLGTKSTAIGRDLYSNQWSDRGVGKDEGEEEGYASTIGRIGAPYGSPLALEGPVVEAEEEEMEPPRSTSHDPEEKRREPSCHSILDQDPFLEETASSTDEYESYYTNEEGPALDAEGSYEYVSDYEYVEDDRSGSMSSSIVSSPFLKPEQKE